MINIERICYLLTLLEKRIQDQNPSDRMDHLSDNAYHLIKIIDLIREELE